MEEGSSTEIFGALDEVYDSEESENEVDAKDKNVSKRHKRMLNDISSITGVPAKRGALRSEPSLQVDEHLWSQKRDGSSKVKLNDLLESVPQTKSLGSLKKKIEKVEKQIVLDAPLSKPQKEKIERTIAYQENAMELSKWAPTVLKNRKAENLAFPLQSYKDSEVSTKTISVGFKPRTSLEKEIAAVLKGSASVLERQNKELTEQEEKALQAFDLEEAMARRKELQKLRALQSYYEIKCKRQKKIKSKKFRKVLRKSEQKKEAKKATELNEGEKEELLEETEKKRVLERAHLRHRNTSKWAKKLVSKSNRSKEESQLLHDQLQASRQLTEQKVYEPDSDDDEDSEPATSEGFALLKASADTKDNPWLLGNKGQSPKEVKEVNLKEDEEDDDTSDDDGEGESAEEEIKSDEEWDEAGKCSEQPGSQRSSKRGKNKKTSLAGRKKDSKREDDGGLESDVEYEHIIDVTEQPDDADQQLDKESRNERDSNHAKDTKVQGGPTSIVNQKGNLTTDAFESVESKALDVDLLITDHSDQMGFSRSDKQISLIREAFADDAVVQEFEEEKRQQNEKRTPKDSDRSLPGWGDWGGPSIDNEAVLKRKRLRFTKKAKKPPPSKDRNLKHVIINEGANKKFAANQVSSLPFPFSSESQFERSVRQPLGKAWNTPSMTTKLIQPRISTLIGTIIDPIKKTKNVSKVEVDRKQRTRKLNSEKSKSRK